VKVTIFDEAFECARAAKGADYIRLLDAEGKETMLFGGVSDFSAYEIEGGEWEIPIPIPSDIEQIKAENDLLKAQVQALVDRGEFMEDCIAELAMQVYQ